MKKIIRISALALLAAILLCGCCGGIKKTSKKLTSYYSDSPVVAARFYFYEECEELPADRLEALCEKLDSMELEYHMGHVDYFWGNQFGIELELEDGTFITYDGTKYEQRDASMMVSRDSEHKLHSCFLEVKNMDYWEEMSAFFTTVEPSHLQTGW